MHNQSLHARYASNFAAQLGHWAAEHRNLDVSNTDIRLGEDVAISVERMIRFCLLSKMMFEYASGVTKVLPVHLTRFGVLLFETASFLYSLFEDRRDSINLLNIWQGFDHPFNDELKNYVTKLSPFKEELKFVRNRIGFHGSLNRSHEGAGLGIFDAESQRARDFANLVLDMQQLCLRMIAWYMEGMESSARPAEMWKEFFAEMENYSGNQEQHGISGDASLPNKANALDPKS